MSALVLVLRDPVLRIAAVLSFLFGALACSIGPYVSVLAVERFQLGDRGYAAVLAVSTLLSVAASLWVGIRADQTARRRGLTLAALVTQTLGLGLMAVLPNAATFLVFHVLLWPLGGTVFGQIFALARLAALTRPAEERDAVMGVVRAMFAAPFVVVLPLWALAFRAGAPILAVYPVGFALSLAMLAVAWRGWPRDGATHWQDAGSGLSFRAALHEIAHPRLLSRVVMLGAVGGMMTLYIALIGLILTPAIGRGPQDVALYVGLVAGLEVPFMLAVPRLTRGISRARAILLASLVYVLHLGLLPVLAPGGALWLLVLPAAAGGAVIITLPIAYLQDLLAERPGTGAALMALQRLAGDVLAALAFGLGTWVSGYGAAALVGCVLGLAGAVWLALADRRRRSGRPAR